MMPNPDRPDHEAEFIARAADKIRDAVTENLDLIFRRDDALEVIRLFLEGDLTFMVNRHGVGFYGDNRSEPEPPGGYL
ncbi:hypothetical protein ACFWY6_10815 [Streptomyces sp. NPDC059037]|uniref:hypothetical protein n=1 Tax=Streptomyces sp. NPDC059037 TaxID=3346710 RepID=UPI0036B21D51